MSPKTAAPGDPVKVQVLVPNERDESTVRVSLQIPKDVLPFSFNNPPGWQRKLDKAADGSIEVVRWSGRLRSDGFTEFSFLASVPEREGPIAWKAIQVYARRQESRWIGAPDSEEPAAVTQVTADAPRQNAGGEASAATTDEAATTEPATSTGGGDDSTRDWLAVALGAGGLALGGVALLVALSRRSHQP